MRRLVLGGVIFFFLSWDSDCLVEAETRVQREAVNCGPNAVLMFLTLSGVDPPDEIINGIECSVNGTSMADLQRACNLAGVEVEIRKYSPGQIPQIPLPAICQTKSGSLKHFMVIYAVDDKGLHSLDGTTGKYRIIRPNKYESFLSGYALIRSEPLHQKLLADLGTTIVLCGLLLIRCFL